MVVKCLGRIPLLHSLSLERAFARQSMVLFIASTLGNVFSYLYLLFAGRSLGTESYGMFGSLFGIFYVFSLVGDALRITIASKVASLKGTEGNSNAIKSVLKPILILASLGLLIILAIMVNYRRIGFFFHLSNPDPVLVLGASLLTTLFLFIFLGLIQGLQLFKWLAAIGWGPP